MRRRLALFALAITALTFAAQAALPVPTATLGWNWNSTDYPPDAFVFSSTPFLDSNPMAWPIVSTNAAYTLSPPPTANAKFTLWLPGPGGSWKAVMLDSETGVYSTNTATLNLQATLPLNATGNTFFIVRSFNSIAGLSDFSNAVGVYRSPSPMVWPKP